MIIQFKVDITMHQPHVLLESEVVPELLATDIAGHQADVLDDDRD